MDRGIDGVEIEIERRWPPKQIEMYIRKLRDEARQSLSEPARAEGRQDAERERTAQGIGADIEGGGADTAQGLADVARIALSGKRQANGLLLTHEELEPKPLLERLDLPADRALREIELARRIGNAARPGGSLESMKDMD